MKFSVSRTSTYDDKPCEEAKEEQYTRIEYRTVDSVDKIPDPRDRENWYKIGRNHRIENGMVARDFDAVGWFVELNTLEELLAFYNKYGSLVISSTYGNPHIVEVEIYDSYRE